MSTFQVPARRPHPFFHRPSTRLGTRSVKWLGYSFGLLVAAAATSIITESITGGGVHHHGVMWAMFGVVWSLALWAAGGVAAASLVGAVTAIVRHGERSWAAFVVIVPALLLLLIVLHPLFLND